MGVQFWPTTIYNTIARTYAVRSVDETLNNAMHAKVDLTNDTVQSHCVSLHASH